MKSVKWILNPLMLWGAGLGWFIGASAMHLADTISHKGPGIVHYGDGERSPEWSEEVSESQYKRHNYAMGEFMLILGVTLWIIIANDAKKQVGETEACKEYLCARYETKVAHNVALRRVLGAEVYEAAAGEAERDPAYQAANTNEMAKYVDHARSSKAAKVA